jgi:hypothetical protein
MNCYLCLVETGCTHQLAYALCQKCMAGICQDHLVAMGTVSLSGYPPRPHFLCQRCYHLTSAPSGYSRQGDHRRENGDPPFSWRSWWQQLWLPLSRRLSPLPTPEEALETVEDYLRQQRH